MIVGGIRNERRVSLYNFELGIKPASHLLTHCARSKHFQTLSPEEPPPFRTKRSLRKLALQHLPLHYYILQEHALSFGVLAMLLHLYYGH